jgi:hypothetical protein
MFGRIHLARHLLSTCHQTNTLQRAHVLVSQSAEGLLTTSPHFTSNFSVERLMVRH